MLPLVSIRVRAMILLSPLRLANTLMQLAKPDPVPPAKADQVQPQAWYQRGQPLVGGGVVILVGMARLGDGADKRGVFVAVKTTTPATAGVDGITYSNNSIKTNGYVILHVASFSLAGAMSRTDPGLCGKMLAGKPLVEITKIGDSDPIPFPEGDRPLSGIKVLDLTRILAGPITARTLAENSAEVLMVTAEHLPQVPEHVELPRHGAVALHFAAPVRPAGGEWSAIVKLRDEVRAPIQRYCGEPVSG